MSETQTPAISASALPEVIVDPVSKKVVLRLSAPPEVPLPRIGEAEDSISPLNLEELNEAELSLLRDGLRELAQEVVAASRLSQMLEHQVHTGLGEMLRTSRQE